jgi:hypothetical protein
MTIEIFEGQVCRLNGSKFEPVSVDEYWSHSEGKETSPEGLHLLGLAHVGIFVSYSTSPVLRFHLRTEIGKKEIPEDAHFPADHIVIDNFWIPFEKTSVSVITDFINSNKIKNNN